jgi:ATPase involved in DNA replication initiation
VPESRIWNARRSGDSIIRTPARDTRDIVEEIIWWHNAVNGVQLTLQDIMTRSREQHIVYCRADIMRRLREVKGWSYPRIGQYFGGMDHSTVMHHVKRPTMAVRAPVSVEVEKRIARKKAKLVGPAIATEARL